MVRAEPNVSDADVIEVIDAVYHETDYVSLMTPKIQALKEEGGCPLPLRPRVRGCVAGHRKTIRGHEDIGSSFPDCGASRRFPIGSPRHPNSIIDLQSKPHFRRNTKVRPEPQHRVGGNRTKAVDDRADAIGRNIQIASQLINADPRGFMKSFSRISPGWIGSSDSGCFIALPADFSNLCL